MLDLQERETDLKGEKEQEANRGVGNIFSEYINLSLRQAGTINKCASDKLDQIQSAENNSAV